MDVQSNAKGADIWVDGNLAGRVPAVLEVRPGRHVVEIRRQGFQTSTDEVDVRPGENKLVFASLGPGEPKPVPAPVEEHKPQPAPPAPPPPPPPEAYPPPQPVQLLAPPPPSPPEVPPLGFRGRDISVAYLVSFGTGESCITPCRLSAQPGGNTIEVRGPGSKAFRRYIQIPAGRAEFRVQHFTKSRVIAGTILTVLGIPLTIGGGLYFQPDSSGTLENIQLAIGSVLLAHGVVFTIAGIAELGTIRRNSVEVVQDADY